MYLSEPLNTAISLLSPIAEDVSPWLPCLGSLAVYTVLGLLADLVGLRLLLRAAEKTPWQLDNDLIHCFIGKTFFLFLLFGLDTAVSLLPTFTPFHIVPTIKPVAHQLFLCVSILIASWMLGDIVISFVKHLSNRMEALPSTSIFHNIIRIFIMCVGILVVLQTLGISIIPILTALGVGGLAISLALKDTLENIFAGFQIIFSKQVRIGDYVRIDNGIEGYAEDIGWRNSFIRQPNENLVIVPNAKLAASIVTNFSRPSTQMAITLEGVVNFYSNLDLVERTLMQSAENIIEREETANKKRKPKLRLIGFSDQGVKFKLYVYVCHHKDEYVLLHALLKEVHKNFRTAGITFYNAAPPPPVPPELLEKLETSFNEAPVESERCAEKALVGNHAENGNGKAK